jgi:hypothetical protein
MIETDDTVISIKITNRLYNIILATYRGTAVGPSVLYLQYIIY